MPIHRARREGFLTRGRASGSTSNKSTLSKASDFLDGLILSEYPAVILSAQHHGVCGMILRERNIHPKVVHERTVGGGQEKTNELGKDRRRKHHHWRVTIYYGDGETFARVYIGLEKAHRFAQRQKKSPIVTRTRITRIS